MAKNVKDEKTNVMRLLEQKGIPYTAHAYAHEEGVAVDGVTVANMLGQDPEQVFTTLVARGASKGIYVFVIPVADSLDLKKAARAVGEKNNIVDVGNVFFSITTILGFALVFYS